MKLIVPLILSAFFTYNLFAQTIVKHHLNTKIRDMRTSEILITDVKVERIGKFKLSLNIKHNDWRDLTVTLIAPDRSEFVLYNHNRKGKGKLKLRFTEKSRQLAHIGEVGALGNWKILIYDGHRGDEGKATYLYMDFIPFMDGDIPPHGDNPSPDPTPTPVPTPVPTPTPEPGDRSQAQCHQSWDTYLASHQLPVKFERLKYLCDGALKTALNKIERHNHKVTGYREARQFMFSKLDNVKGVVCGVYTGECINTRGIPNNTKMNCEHTWPKSKGAGSAPAKFDLHHLFPTKSDINSTRSSYPFCELVSKKTGRGGSALGHGRDGRTCFEPRDDHKGDVARAMMYFSIRYQMRIDAEQEFFFRKWNKQDPVNRHEQLRNISIEEYQGNINPFVELPELVQFISNF